MGIYVIGTAENVRAFAATASALRQYWRLQRPVRARMHLPPLDYAPSTGTCAFRFVRSEGMHLNNVASHAKRATGVPSPLPKECSARRRNRAP
jgi:hypothetical protein